MAFMVILGGCNNKTHESKLVPILTYSYTADDSASVRTYLDGLSSLIDTSHLLTQINDFSNQNKVMGIGIQFSLFNPDTNCFLETNSCKEFSVSILLDPREAPVIPNELESDLKEYINSAVKNNSHNNAFQATSA